MTTDAHDGPSDRPPVVLPVRTLRIKARHVAYVEVSADQDVREALERLRSWTLTRGFETGSKMSFTKPFAGSQSTEVRCPVKEIAGVHPDVGIGLRHLPSIYVAMVEIRDAAAEPATVAQALSEWADKNGYNTADAAEVFLTAEDQRNYELAVPIVRRRRTNSIEVRRRG